MIAFAQQGDIPQLKKIWHACFDDSAAFVDSHYAHGSNCMRTLVYREEDGTISSMLDMVDISLRFAGTRYSAFYIYAASTLPAYQGRRRMHRLIERSCEIAKGEGMAASLLIPQTESLIKFYGRQGYGARISVDERLLTAEVSSSRAEEIGEQEFIRMKREYEAQQPSCVVHSEELLSLIYRQTIVSDGKILKIHQNGRQAYALCYKIEEQGFIQEISSGEVDLLNDVSAVCGTLGVARAQVRRPGGGRLYGLARPLTDAPLPWEELYMNTMLD